MTSGAIGRRAFLAMGASLALAGCATSVNLANLPVIKAVRVSGGGNRWLETMPAYVQRNLIQQLGSRYQPGAGGGATLVVQLTDISLPSDSDSAGLISFDSVDTLDGRVSLLSASGRPIRSFPLFVSTASVDAAVEIAMPTPRRYDWLASSYAHWLLSKLA